MVSVGYPLLAGFYLLLILYVITTTELAGSRDAADCVAVAWLTRLWRVPGASDGCDICFQIDLAFDRPTSAQCGKRWSYDLALLLTLALCQLSWA